MLGLVLDDLGDLAGVNRRQLNEFGEDMKARSANVDLPGLDALFSQQPLQRFENGRFARGFLGPFRPEGLEAVLLQAQAAGFVDFKLGELEAARAEING